MYALEIELATSMGGNSEAYTSFYMMACWEIGRQKGKLFSSFQEFLLLTTENCKSLYS